MAKRNPADEAEATAFDSAGAHIAEISLQDEASRSFLEYAYSVITSRALPDARDGLKPVHRRILYSMAESGLRPDHAYVKSARVVGNTMGSYHPHGDSAIYEALVRLAQSFSLNATLVDGNGNFGSPNDGPAASRYTECRMAPAATLLTGELDEGTVDFIPNYDGSLDEPSVMPAAFPNLLVNGTTGIAVGMATNMIPHNLGEVVAAARLLVKNPAATLDELMALVPGPDLPTGGLLIGLDEVRRAYSEGKGSVRIRAKVEIEPLEGSRGRMSLVATELPYGVGTERIIEKIKEEVGKKRLTGISDVKDLSDRRYGTRLVIEAKTGVNPQALLGELYRYTPLETTFSISNLALVDGQPRTLGLKDLLEVFLGHRFQVVTRRTQFRLDKAKARQHIIDGLLIALDAIDEVVKVIRASKDTAEARTNLMTRFKLSEIQTGHILDMPLRRLVNLEVEALRGELAELLKTIAGLEKILGSDSELRKVVDAELGQVSEKFPTPRRTELVGGDLKEVLAATAAASAPLQVADEACLVALSVTGMIGRTAVTSEEAEAARGKKGRAKHDALVSLVPARTHGQVLAITSKGRAIKINVIELPSLPIAPGTMSLTSGARVGDVVNLTAGERLVAVVPAALEGSPGIAMGTRAGVVKVAAFDWPTRNDEFDIIALKGDDEVLSAAAVEPGSQLVFVSTDGSLLTFAADSVRPQGRTGAGMAGIKLADGAQVAGFACVPAEASLVTWTGVSAKVTPLSAYPAKGRATGGVRAHRFLKGEEKLLFAWAGLDPVGVGLKGEAVQLPNVDERRDGSGTPVEGLAAAGRLYSS